MHYNDKLTAATSGISIKASHSFKKWSFPLAGLLFQVKTVTAPGSSSSINGTCKASQSKYWRYRILGVSHPPTDSSRLSAVGRPGLASAPPGSPPHVFPASPPRYTTLLWEAKRAEEEGWQGAAASNTNTWTQDWKKQNPAHIRMCFYCTRTRGHTHTQYASFLLFLLHSVEIHTRCMPGI